MMSVKASSLELLPNELLDEIISLVSSPPPSSIKLHQPPGDHLTKSRTRNLKNLSRTCSRLLNLVRPWLFSHSRFDLKDADEYLSFICQSEIGRCVTTIVVKAGDAPDDRGDPYWWRQVLCAIDPLRVTVLAPPTFIGSMMGTQLMDGHSWAFEISCQILQLEYKRPPCNISPSSSLSRQTSILEARPWSSLQFNEASSLKAYNHYEYFLFQVPSLFNRWGSIPCGRLQLERSQLSLSLNNLTSFRYTAVFPFYNHVKLVLDTVELMRSLRSLSIQLGPSRNDRVTELEQRGSMDPSDPWMELATGYSLIAHVVRDLGNRGNLQKFTACDYESDALRTELSSILGDIFDDGGWVHDGYGTWTRNSSARGNQEEHSMTVK